MTPSSTSGRAPDRRAAYLAAARRLFDQHGYAGTSMDQVVAEVGGSKATLYRCFPSKADLVAGLMDQVASSVGQRTEALVDEDLPLEDALTAIGRNALRGVTGPDAVAVLRISLAERFRFPELARTVWERGPALTYDRFRRFLEQRTDAGELHVDDPQLAAEHFLAGLVGHLQPKVAMGIAEAPDDAEVDRRVAAAVRAFLAAYGTGADDVAGRGR